MRGQPSMQPIARGRVRVPAPSWRFLLVATLCATVPALLSAPNPAPLHGLGGGAAVGPAVIVSLVGTGQLPPDGRVTFLATVSSAGVPLARLQASSSGGVGEWQTLAV